jgi:hypothetical protein
MKTTGRIFTLLTICLFSLLPKIVLADIHTAATCQNKAGQTDVQTAVNAASSGDAVIVPAGSCTWDATLIITKGIRLQGAGVGSTVITSNMASTGDYLIKYQPSNILADEPFTVAGFTLDMALKSGGIFLENTNMTNGYELHRIKIHNNSFLNGINVDSIYVKGQVYGVVYNNTFTTSLALMDYIGGDFGAWNNISVSFADANALYFEDNTITSKEGLVGSARGARYIFRYNDLIISAQSNASVMFFDLHGNQSGGGGLTGAMQGEFYGNKVTDLANPQRFSMFLDQRGGKAMVFNNSMTSTSDGIGVRYRDEYPESVAQVTNPAGQPQHVSDSYSWSNYRLGNLMNTYFRAYAGTATGGGNNYIDDSTQQFRGGSGTQPFCTSSCTMQFGVKITGGTGQGQFRTIADNGVAQTKITVNSAWDTNPDATSIYEVRMNCCGEVEENREFWTMRTGTFDGTGGYTAGGGVGCGTLAAMNAINPGLGIHVGVGFWATNQSCSNLTGLVGANPATPISGTLYKWSGTKWVAYYSPYQYPHPLRASDSTVPKPPRSLRTGSLQ